MTEIRNIAREVLETLGPGYVESVYRLAMAVELRTRGIPFVQEQSADVIYKNHWVGRKQIDLVIDGWLAVELKVRKAKTVSLVRSP